MGRDAGDSNGSSAQDCSHMILFLILPLGLYSTLTFIPHLSPGSPPSSPSLSLQCLSQCPVLSPSAEGTPWLALQVTGRGFGQGPLHVTGSFQHPVHSAPSPLHPACWAIPTAPLGSPSLVGALVADWGQESCHSFPSMMQIPGRMGWGQGGAMGSLCFFWCALPVISCTYHLGLWLAAFGDSDLQPCMPAALPPVLSGDPGNKKAF